MYKQLIFKVFLFVENNEWRKEEEMKSQYRYLTIERRKAARKIREEEERIKRKGTS
jgi:hypothetical protein